MNTFIVSSRELFTKCEKLARVINSKNSLPVLDNFLFNVSEGEMRISASDSEHFATGTLEVTGVDNPFVFGLNARTMVAALKELAEQPLTVEVDGTTCTIRYANGHFNLPVADVTEYPVFPKMKDAAEVTVSFDTLKRILSKCPAFAANDELRPVMNSVCFDYADNRLNAVASDGHALIKLTEACTTHESKGLFMMSIKTAKLTDSFMDKEGEDVTICHDTRNSYVKIGSYELTARLIEGKYPNYNAVIPVNYNDYVEFDRKEMISVARRVGVFANTASQLLKVAVSGMEMNVSGEDMDFSTKAQATLMVSKSGKDLTIGLKSTIMQTILNAFSCERISLQYMDASRAVIYRPADPEEGWSQLVLQMPMMLNE